MLSEQLVTKWKAILDHEDLQPVKQAHRRATLAQILENTENALRDGSAYSPQFLLETNGVSASDGIPANFMGSSSSTQGTGGIDTFDPVLISLVRRSMPNLIAYDICGVQPMSGPTGLIFAMRTRYNDQANAEAFYNEANTAWSSVTTGANTIGQKNVGNLPGNTSVLLNLPANGVYNYAGGMSTAQGEALGTNANTAFPQMAFSIEKVTVTAKTRALKAEYTMEIAQDLKAIHGLDAETELSNILSAELLADINREVVRTINVTATPGAQDNTTTAGIFDLDTDSNGRWAVEKYKGMMMQLEREANAIAKATRRGKGNIVVCSSDVASALQMAGVLDYTPALNSNNLQVDDTGNTFAGVLNGRLRVYIDPYSVGQYYTVGYKGASAYDAGLFYCPYVPLQAVRAVDQDSMQPKIGFKTRYGMVSNPFSNGYLASGVAGGLGALIADSNVYYRRVLIQNIL